jgi:hypothetical protein
MLLMGLAAPTVQCQTGGGAATQLAAKVENLCALDGRVIDAVTGDPVKKATVTLTPNDAKAAPSPAGLTLPVQFSTSSDGSGRFAMKDLDPGLGDHRSCGRT